MSFLQCIKPKIDGDMENHPLNLAHRQQRRAESHLKHNRYEEALQCHHNAAELLLDAMKSTTSTVALESISLQHSYHLKQKDLIESKKEQYVRVKRAMDAIKNMSKDPKIDITDAAKIQVAIYKNIDESETLLSKLSLNQEIAVGETSDPKEVKEAKKKEKSQQIVIEELQILSQNLHALVEQLVLQVEVLKDENATFKDRVNYLEKERITYLNIIIEEDRHPSLIIKNKYFIDSPSKEPESPVYMNIDFKASKGNK